MWRKHLVIFARRFWRFKMSLHIQETKNWQRSVFIYMYIVLQEEFCNYFFFLKSFASKNLFWSHIEWESFLSNSTDSITIIYYQTMRMTLVWEQKLHLFIRKYCKGYTYVEGTMACSGLFTNTWICPNVSCKTRVGRFNLHSLSRVVVVYIY